jgi:hypothetical protein
VQSSLAQPDRGVERGEAAEAHMEGRNRRAWPDHTIFVLENLLQLGTHANVSLYRFHKSVVAENTPDRSSFVQKKQLFGAAESVLSSRC